MDPEKPPPLKVTATRLARAVAVFANSEAGSKAAWLFAALLVLLLAANGLTVVNSFVGRNFMTAIVDRREAEFVRVNVVITAVWAAAFAAMAVIDLAWLMIPTLPPRVVIIATVLALFGAVKFTGWYPDRKRAASARPTNV